MKIEIKPEVTANLSIEDEYIRFERYKELLKSRHYTLTVRGKAKSGSGWVYGYYYEKEGKQFIFNYEREDQQHVEIIPGTVCRSTERKDMNGKQLFEGDLILGSDNRTKMEIRYGEYEGYCLQDKAKMPSIGFFASARTYYMPDMVLGRTEDYALLVGNIIDDREE